MKRKIRIILLATLIAFGSAAGFTAVDVEAGRGWCHPISNCG